MLRLWDQTVREPRLAALTVGYYAAQEALIPGASLAGVLRKVCVLPAALGRYLALCCRSAR